MTFHSARLGDYDIDGVVGADEVRAYGGDVKVARQDPGRSTSKIIAGLDPSSNDR